MVGKLIGLALLEIELWEEFKPFQVLYFCDSDDAEFNLRRRDPNSFKKETKIYEILN